MDRSTPRIAVCHPRLGSGGSEARALWLLQALRGEAALTLITAGAVDLPRLNAYYGTDLARGDFRVLRPALARGLSFTQRANGLRGALFERGVRRVAGRFDATISAYNPMALGRPAIHFLADFSWLPEVRSALHGTSSAPRTYRRIVDRLSGEGERWSPVPGDLLVANSGFTARLLRERLGLECGAVVQPPVAGPLGGLPWAERSPAFLSLGRLAPEKRIEDQIAILQGVRARGHDVRLTVVGGPTQGPYFERLQALVAGDPDWVTWRGWVGGAAKWPLLGAHRFALHACRGEAFGISVAELVRAGCLTFVPARGAPAEIVGDEQLVYADLEQGIEKIVARLEDEAGQEEASRALVARGAAFGAARFMDEARTLVTGWLGR